MGSDGWTDFGDNVSDKWNEFKKDVSEQYDDLSEKFDNLTEDATDKFDDWFCTCSKDVHEGYGDCKGELHNEKYICYVRNPQAASWKNYHIFYDFGADQYYTHELCKQTEQVDADAPKVEVITTIPATTPTEEVFTCWDHFCVGNEKPDVSSDKVCGDNENNNDCEKICCEAVLEEIQTPEKLPIAETEVPRPATKEPVTCWDHFCEGELNPDVEFTKVCGDDSNCEKICCLAPFPEVKEELEKKLPDVFEKAVGELTCWEHECEGTMNFHVGFEDICGKNDDECEKYCCVTVDEEEPKEEKVIPVICDQYCGTKGAFHKVTMKNKECNSEDCFSECCDPILPGNNEIQTKPEEIPEEEEKLEIEQQAELPEIKRTADEDCWTECNEKNGKCDWCGRSGKCCRKGHAGGGCNGQEGPEDRHICVYAPLNVPLNCENTTEKVLGYTCDEWKWQSSENNRAWNLSSWAKVDGICYDADYSWPKMKTLNDECKKLCQPQVCAPKEPEQDCWAPCNEKNGKCDWCQYGGKCCRKGHVGDGCSGDEGHDDRHICVYEKPIAFLKSNTYQHHRRLMDGLRGSMRVESQDHSTRRNLSKVLADEKDDKKKDQEKKNEKKDEGIPIWDKINEFLDIYIKNLTG